METGIQTKRTQLVVGGPPLPVVLLGALAPFSCGSKDTWRRNRNRRQTSAKTNRLPRWQIPKPSPHLSQTQRQPPYHQESRENSIEGENTHAHIHLPFQHESSHPENSLRGRLVASQKHAYLPFRYGSNNRENHPAKATAPLQEPSNIFPPAIHPLAWKKSQSNATCPNTHSKLLPLL